MKKSNTKLSTKKGKIADEPLLATCAFKVGDKIKWNETQRRVRGDSFTGGKIIETIVKIVPSNKPRETQLWMSNGLQINPECVVLA